MTASTHQDYQRTDQQDADQVTTSPLTLEREYHDGSRHRLADDRAQRGKWPEG
jgi:hypothetical protein